MTKGQGARVKGKGYKRILVVRLDRIGDVLLSTPVIKNIRDAYPDSYIAFMVRPYCKDIVAGNPNLNEVIIYDKDGREKTLAGNIKFILRLRKKRFDLAIVLHPTNRSHQLVFFAGIPERVGYDRKLGALLTRRIPHAKQFGLKHEIEYTLDMLRYVGIEPRDKKLYMPIRQDSEYRVRDLLKRHGVSESDRLITVNPGASCRSKRWPSDKFADACDRLSAKYGAKIVLISDLKEKMIADSVSRFMNVKPINLAGNTTVSDIASILKRSRLFISNDSGPVHIACAVGTPVISIFGRSDRGLSPKRWGPTNPGDIALHKDVGCSECLAHNCRKGFKCLEAVTVKDVVEAAGRILG